MGRSQATAQRERFLVEALADGRVKAPSLERLENSATEIAKRSTTDERRYAAIDATRAIAQAVRLTNLIASDPSRIYAARDAVIKARDRFIPFEASFPTSVTERGARTLTALKDVTDLWVAVWTKGPDTPDWGTRVNARCIEATAEYEAFRVVVSKELARLASLPVDQRSTGAPNLGASAVTSVPRPAHSGGGMEGAMLTRRFHRNSSAGSSFLRCNEHCLFVCAPALHVLSFFSTYIAWGGSTNGTDTWSAQSF